MKPVPNHAARFLSSFFGLGFLPGAPGTYASVAAFGIFVAFVALGVAEVGVPLAFALFAVAAVVLGRVAAASNDGDPRWFVLDEMAGLFAAVAFRPVAGLRGSLAVGAAALVLFRAFDIVKPFGIRRLEKLPGGWGITADDVAAGVLANVVARVLAGFMYPGA